MSWLVLVIVLAGLATAQYYQQYQYQQYQPYVPQQYQQYQPIQYQQQIIQPPQQYLPQPALQSQQPALPPLQPLPIARAPFSQPQGEQYLQKITESRKSRRFIASYWDPQKQQTIYYERFEPEGQQFAQQPQFPPPPSPQFTPQQSFGGQFFRQLQPQQQVDPLSGQLITTRPPPPPPAALHLPPTAVQTHQKTSQQQQAVKIERKITQQPRTHNRFPMQRPRRPEQIAIKSGNTENRVFPPPPPGKFNPYPQDVFNPLDTKLTPPVPPEVLVVGGSTRPIEQSAIEEIPRETVHQSSTFPQQQQLRPQPQQQQFQSIPQPQQVHKQPPQPKPQRPAQKQPENLPKQPPKIQPIVPNRVVSVLEQTFEEPEDANGHFLQCCQKRKVDKKCESRCNFDTMNKKMLMAMFLGTDPCPQSYGRDLLSCAAQDLDHTQCCIERGVHETSAGKKCLGFCNMSPDNTFQADASMIPCWAVLNDIKVNSIFLDDVSLTELAFSPQYAAAVEAKQVAAQEAQHASFLVDRAKQNRPEKIVQAEGEAQSAKLLGEALRGDPGYLKLRKFGAAQQISKTVSGGANNKVLVTRPVLFNNFDKDILTLPEMVLQSTDANDAWFGFHVVDFCAQFEDLGILSDFVAKLKTAANYEQLKIPTCETATDSEDDSFEEDDDDTNTPKMAVRNLAPPMPQRATCPRNWEHLLVKGVKLQERNPHTQRYFNGPEFESMV
ncbi:unnamed protein product, partial [Mesorhabditis belari]|uniref:Domain of unknown function DB domain-containing protein n=1 Tax=Mesorhabditis belari TaxID=2138241 RepID=A0AAF3EUG6_9BILA